MSTQELESILASGRATVLDARPHLEYAISHIPGALNVAPKPDVPMSLYVSDVAEIGRLLRGNKSAPVVIYCNGIHCGKSRRLAAELLEAGYADVRRYQLGIPMWRAAGGVCEVEIEGMRHIYANDRTAVVIDTRESAEFQKVALRSARNIPRSLVLEGKDVGEVKRAKDDGRLPMEDHNTRILVVGADGAAARYVAEALARSVPQRELLRGAVRGGPQIAGAGIHWSERILTTDAAHDLPALGTQETGGFMSKDRCMAGAFLSGLVGVVAIGSFALASETTNQSVNGTVWVANRGNHTIRGFDAATGAVVNTVAMASNSQPGDLAYAKGKLYVAEEFGTPPAIAIVDAETGVVFNRLFMPAGSRPHHVHASVGENLVAVGLYGTDMVAVVDAHNDTLLGLWDSNPLTTNGRVHAAEFSKDGNTLYLTSDASSEVIALDPRTGDVFWRMTVPGVHELVVTHDGKTAYASRRTANTLSVINLEDQTYEDVLALGLPDTLRLSANEKMLTVGLRTMPAQLVIVDTSTFEAQVANLGPAGEPTTLAAHQWTSPSGRYTFAAFEGGTSPGVAVIDHAAGHQVIQRFGYSGRPHGVDFARP